MPVQWLEAEVWGFSGFSALSVQVSPLSGDEEIRLEVLVEYSAARPGSGDGGPVCGRRLSLPVQLFVQPALRVRQTPSNLSVAAISW
jgi:hypothetical protein